jgi:hypothetical protein
MIQGCFCCLSNNGCCTDDEQPSEIAISLLGDAAEPLLATRRVLPRHKSDPRCKIPTGFEATRVCDSGSDGRGPDHAYPGYSFEAAAHIIGTMMRVNGAIQSSDLQFQSSELIDNSLQCLFHRRWKSFVITLVRDDRAKLRESFASRLRNEAELGKVGSGARKSTPWSTRPRRLPASPWHASAMACRAIPSRTADARRRNCGLLRAPRLPHRRRRQARR